jgi:uncharacterized membrane protein HdeD (DUF308 family)
MPLLVLSLVIVVVLALVAKPVVAYSAAGVLGVAGIVQMVWAAADGKGDDPWWLVLIGIAGLAVNLAAVAGLSRSRAPRAA